jgi:cytochrome c5
MRNLRWMMTVAVVAAAVSGCGGDDGDGGAGRGGRARNGDAPKDLGPPPGQLPQGVTAAQGSEGRALYRSACVMCHGESGQGTQLGPSVVDSTWTRGSGTYEEIIAVVGEGAAATEEFGVPMPPRGNGKLTDEQIRAVSAYTYSLAHPRT